MGDSSVRDMIEHAGVDVALEWHIRHNHFPPLPWWAVAKAKEVMELAKAGKWEQEVSLAGIATYRGRNKAPVRAFVEAWHLDAFIEQED